MKFLTGRFSQAKLLVALASCFVAFISTGNAYASGITLNVIGPHEYALPVNYEPSFNAIVQYGYLQSDNRAFNSNGDRVKGPDTTTFVGFTKYVRFFTIKSLPDVGFAFEGVLPEISVQGKGISASGIGDPLPGAAVWIKPSKNSTVGLQTFLSVPVGNSEVSDKTWGSLTTIFGDVQLGNLDIDGQIGGVVKSTRHQNGADDVDPGSTFHANVRFAYRINKYLEPFLAVDHQTTGSSKDEATGQTVANSASRETSLGGGVVVNITDTIGIAARYDVGVEGKNTPVTSAFHFKLSYIW